MECKFMQLKIVAFPQVLQEYSKPKRSIVVDSNFKDIVDSILETIDDEDYNNHNVRSRNGEWSEKRFLFAYSIVPLMVKTYSIQRESLTTEQGKTDLKKLFANFQNFSFLRDNERLHP